VFFNLFAAAEPYISVTITHGTPCNDLRVQWQSRIFKVSGDQCPQRSQEAKNLRESGEKLSNAEDKGAGKTLV